MYPEPMKDPCIHCGKQHSCDSSDTYKCPAFHQEFVRAWDETVAFFRQQLQRTQEEDRL